MISLKNENPLFFQRNHVRQQHQQQQQQQQQQKQQQKQQQQLQQLQTNNYYFLLEPNDQCHLILTIITHLEAYAPGRRCGGLFPQFKHYLNMHIKSGMGMRSPEPFQNCMNIYIHWLCSRLLARVVRCSASGSVLYSSPATA